MTDVQARTEGLTVSFDGPKAPATDTFDRILVAVGRSPNGKLIGAEQAGVAVDDRGFIGVSKQMRTNVPHIFAIGDVVGQPMLAHKAMHEGKVAAEVIAGKNSFFDARAIPSVAYTDPEVAWVGVTENERPILAHQAAAVFRECGFKVGTDYISDLNYRYLASSKLRWLLPAYNALDRMLFAPGFMKPLRAFVLTYGEKA